MINDPNGPACPGGRIYTIRGGDSLYSVALRFNTTVGAILRANPGLDPDDFRVGRQICIPVDFRACLGFLYTVQPRDSIYRISRQYGISVQALVDANPNMDPDNLPVGQQICIPEVSRRQPVPSRPAIPPRGLPSRPSLPSRPRRSAVEDTVQSDDPFYQSENSLEGSVENTSDPDSEDLQF